MIKKYTGKVKKINTDYFITVTEDEMKQIKNDYPNFIVRNSNYPKDIYFHKTQILDQSTLSNNDFVEFECISDNNKHGIEPAFTAVNVKKLTTEVLAKNPLI